MQLLSSVLLVVAATSAVARSDPPGLYGSSSDTCDCPDVEEPVCGSDGDTYNSKCHARCAGVKPLTPGRCDRGCFCGTEVEPFCGGDGVTYTNSCLLDCKIGLAGGHVGPCKPCSKGCVGTEVKTVCTEGEQEYDNACWAECAGFEAQEGVCPGEECCPEEAFGGEDGYDPDTPACGVDGKTYKHDCEAHCFQVEMAYKGECDLTCDCEGAEAKPVCGIDGVTYDNACLARCKPMAVAFEGPCMEQCDCVADELKPVCTRDDNTYLNECFARCAHAIVIREGPCK